MGTLHDLPRLLTEEEVCKALGLSVYTLRRERAAEYQSRQDRPAVEVPA